MDDAKNGYRKLLLKQKEKGLQESVLVRSLTLSLARREVKHIIWQRT